MRLFDVSKENGLKNENFYKTATIVCETGDNTLMKSLLFHTNKETGEISVGVSIAGYGGSRPSVEWLKFHSLKEFKLFVSTVKGFYTFLEASHHTDVGNTFLFGYSKEGVEAFSSGEKQAEAFTLEYGETYEVK